MLEAVQKTGKNKRCDSILVSFLLALSVIDMKGSGYNVHTMVVQRHKGETVLSCVRGKKTAKFVVTKRNTFSGSTRYLF